MIISDERLRKALCRHEAFWHCEGAENALVGLSRYAYFPLEDFDLGVDNGLLLPDMLDLDSLIPQYERLFTEGGLYMGDLLWAASPLWGLPWLEAIIGCRIEVSKNDGTIWAGQVTSDISAVPEVRLNQENPWFLKLLEFTHLLANYSQNRFPLSTPLLRGPVDMLAALVGTENLALAAYDIPEKVQQLAYQCAEVYIAVAKAQLGIMPPFFGGYSQQQHLWAPGSTIMTQQDAALFFTPKNYCDLFLAADRMILGNFDYTIMHLHSTALHLLDDLLALDELTCLQIVIDPTGPSVEELLPIFKKIQACKALVVFGDLDTQEVDFILNKLSPRGLCVYIKHAKAI
jgi:hypothetical protein